MKSRFPIYFFVLGLLCVVAAMFWRLWPRKSGPFPTTPTPMAQPYGMAPAAFDGLLRACHNSQVQPYRVGQTIGDHPLSVGYHKRDGWADFRGQKIEYTAAVDLGASDLSRAQLAHFLESLAAQGFAAFYREGGKWRGHEHIHAIYAPLRMKPQLQGQVRQWISQRKRAGKKAYLWQKRWRDNWRN